MVKITDCAESIVYIEGKTVRKIYKPLALVLDLTWGRKGEEYMLTNYKSKYFIDFIEAVDGGIRVAFGGKRLGGHDRFDKKLLTTLDVNKLIDWLSGLKKELERLGIRHRDINPRNIVYDSKTKEFKLIDFTYSTDEPEDLFDKREKYKLNEHYGITDEIAIDSMIKELKKYANSTKR